MSSTEGSSNSSIPAPHTVSIKIEQTAKGARVSVHVYGEIDSIVKSRAIGLYQSVIKDLTEEGIAVAPIEGGK